MLGNPRWGKNWWDFQHRCNTLPQRIAYKPCHFPRPRDTKAAKGAGSLLPRSDAGPWWAGPLMGRRQHEDAMLLSRVEAFKPSMGATKAAVAAGSLLPL